MVKPLAASSQKSSLSRGARYGCLRQWLLGEDWISHCHASIIEFSWTVLRRNMIPVWTRDSKELIAIGPAESLWPWKERTGGRAVVSSFGLHTLRCG